MDGSLRVQIIISLMDMHTQAFTLHTASMFEDLLELYSGQQEGEGQSSQVQFLATPPQTPLQSQLEEPSELWMAINEELRLCFINTNDETEEGHLAEDLRRVQQLRQEQENKLRELTQSREQLYSCKAHQQPFEHLLLRPSKSLSPRKTKRIDKRKPFKLLSDDF